jgi:hypothetical protein
VALGEGDDPPIRVGTLSLPGEYNLNYGTIDPASGTAYFVAAVQHKVVKVALGAGNAPPTRIGAATFAADETVLAPMVIDPASGYGFVGSHNPIDKVVKFSLGSGQDPPARVGALTLEPNEVNLQCAFLHEGYAYFGTYGPTTGPGRIVKVDPGAGNAPPTRVGSIALEPGEERITRAALDPACGVAYFIFYTQPQSGRVVRVSLKGALPRRLDALTLAPGENSQLWYLLADNAAGHLYLALNGDRLLKVSVAPACSAPVRSGALVLDLRPPFSCAAIDPTSGYAYFGTDSRPGRVTKVALGDGSAAPTVAGELVLNANEGLMDGAVLDPSSGTGFFGCYPGRVVKVALGAGGAPPTRIGAATLDVNQETYFTSAVIDPASGYAYFGTLNQHPRIVKVALGGPGSPPTRVGALALEARYGALHSAAIDLVSGRAFFGSSSGEVVKVALGAGNAPPTRIGQPVFLGAGVLASAAIDSFAGYAYFGTWTSPGAIWKVRLGAPNEPPVRIGVVSLSNEKYLGVAAMDRLSGRALFTSSMSPGRLAKVNLGSGSLLPNRVGGIAVASGESFPVSSVADLGKGLAVLGCQSTLVGVGFSQNGQVKATRMTMPETGNVTDVQLYSHVAGGQVRMAIYDDATTRTLLWQSGAIANTASNGWLAASIASGTPTSLTLNPGTYWLAWQVDTNADTPSFTAGTAGQGFLFRQAFGPFPAGLTTAQVTSTSERWSQFLTYTVPGFAPPRIEVHPQSRVVGSGAPAAFTVVASGSGPLSYRWRKGGVPLATIDAPIVAIPSAGIGDAGTYDVVVSGPSGSVTSNGATLTVTAPSQGVVPWASPGLAPASPGPIGNAPAAPIPDPGRAALMPTVAPGLLSQAFGAGCPGTGGRVPEIGLAEPTAPERDRFSVQLLSARAGAPALLLVSLGLSPTPLDGGCTLYAQTPFAMLPATTDAEGRAATSFPPLPATPGLAGVSAFFQWTVSDPEGSYAGALAFSDALWVALAP